MPISTALIATRAGLHPWSLSSRQGSPGLQVDWIALAHPRCNLDAAMSTAGSMDPMELFRGISGWLCSVGTSQVRSSYGHVDAWSHRLRIDILKGFGMAVRFLCIPVFRVDGAI
ncbi:hypothetical protein SCLCIDRAFT_24305 [Scleroderma citrinum Foug A]|uniref:Uncharacterized protein n=1 Tax=Scleroderma citrinum Foug A TaxID=1036808 RepID=A0A0C2ZPC3_9AGAM|nr:hypothetical protein SCLCIDRAFT_24305 [Scleroderma citrinum Foug A]